MVAKSEKSRPATPKYQLFENYKKSYLIVFSRLNNELKQLKDDLKQLKIITELCSYSYYSKSGNFQNSTENKYAKVHAQKREFIVLI